MTYRNTLLIVFLLIGSHAIVAMDDQDFIFNGKRAYATKELEDQVREDIKHKKRKLVCGWGIAAFFSFSLPLIFPSWVWGGGGLVCMGHGIKQAYDQEDDIAKGLAEECYFDLEKPISQEFIAQADNFKPYPISDVSLKALSAQRSRWSRTPISFDGSYYQEYAKTLLVWLKKHDTYFVPVKIREQILQYAGFDRYKKIQSPIKQMTERDILELSGGNIPVNIMLRGQGGQAKTVQGFSDNVFKLVECYKKYSFLHERGWISLVDLDEEIVSFSPRCVDVASITESVGDDMIEAVELYRSGAYGPYFTTSNPAKFAEHYNFEKDEYYQDIVDSLKTSQQFLNKNKIEQRKAIYSEIIKKK